MRHIGSHELVKLAGARLQHVDEPQAEQLVETLDHCGAPRAAGGADTSQAWYQLRARKRATFAKKS